MNLSSTRLTVTVNTVSQFAGRLLSSGTTFVLTILLARSLGTQGYGDFSKITTFVSFFYLFADFGMNAAFLQIAEEDKRFSFRHLVGTRIVFSALLVFLSISFLSFFPQESTQGYTPMVRLGVILYSASIIVQAMITTLNAVFQKNLRYDLALVAVAGGSVVRLLVTYLFGTGSVLGATLCFFFGAAATMLFAIPLSKSLERSLTPIFSLKHSWILLRASVPLGLTLIFNLIYFRIDSILITLTQSTKDVGIYNLSYNFFEFALVLPVFFLNALFPIFLKRKNESPEAFFLLARKAALALFVASLCITVGMWISAPLISMIKPEFSPGISVIRTLSLSLPFFFLTSLTMWMLITLRKRAALISIYGISMVLNISANSYFIPRMGYMAAAWITVFGEGLVLILSLVVLLREGRQMLPLRRILTP